MKGKLVLNNQCISDFTKQYFVERLFNEAMKLASVFPSKDNKGFFDGMMVEVVKLQDLTVLGYFEARVLDIVLGSVIESTPNNPLNSFEVLKKNGPRRMVVEDIKGICEMEEQLDGT